MSSNGQTHFKNLAAFAARFLSVSDHFTALRSKGLNALRRIGSFKTNGIKRRSQ